ncbi:MAG: hypothetical protein PVI58_17925, partial [Desulfobacterales bacterium]
MRFRQLRDKISYYSLAILLLGAALIPAATATPTPPGSTEPTLDNRLWRGLDQPAEQDHKVSQPFDRVDRFRAQSGSDRSSARQKWQHLSPEQKQQYRQRLNR